MLFRRRSSRVSGTVGLLFAASFGLLGLCAVDGCTAPPATASAAELQDKAPEGASLRRVALVIGNGAYQNGIEVLANPSHDATAFAGVLRQHGFESLLVLDAGLHEMLAALQSFATAAEGAQVAIVFYSGHAVQVDGQNLLIPIDFIIPSDSTKASLERQALPLADLDTVLAGKANSTILLIDACRSNPFMPTEENQGSDDQRGRGVAQRLSDQSGLAVQAAHHLSATVYATGPGRIAFDGAGAYSPFTTALLEHVEASGRNLPDFLTKVRLSVSAATSEAQVPTWDRATLPTVPLFPRGQGHDKLIPVVRMVTGLRPRSEAPDGNNSSASDFKQIPVVEDLSDPPHNFYCEAHTGRGWTQGRGQGSITMNRDGLACSMQIFGYPTQGVPAQDLGVVEGPTHGHIVIRDNSFAYVPDLGFTGTDHFTIRAIAVESTLPQHEMLGAINVAVR
jgi:Caspase domain